ncbi:MAG: PucR family transcriptional regulator [Solirubrobacteraceae bacterium]
MSTHAPLQVIVDSLAADIGRDVAVDDRQIRWLVHSPHTEPPDAARMRSILTRRITEEALRWALSFGIEEAEGPVRLPANPDIGAEARVCIPLRTRGVLLGFMFIVDADGTLDGAPLAQAEAAAAEAAQVLYRERRLRELERERERWLLTHLLGDDDADEAARALADEGFLEPGRVAVLVIRADEEPARYEIAVGAALDRLRRQVPPRGGVDLRRGDHGAFVVVLDDATSPRELAERLLELAGKEGAEAVTRVGIGSAQPLAAAPRSYRQARDAVAIAQRVASFGRVAAWDELGVYRTLARFPDDLDDEALHPGVVELLRDGAHEQLVETLEAYLDRAGDVKATAQALNLHRATLYYRLQRIEEITGARLKVGEDRLALHLGLYLARLRR